MPRAPSGWPRDGQAALTWAARDSNPARQMIDLPRAFALSLGQLADPAILAVLGKSLAVTLALFAALGLGLYYALTAGFAALGWSDGGMAGAAAASILAVIAFWLLFRVVALAVLNFFAEDVVRAVERRHYPAAAQVPELPFATALRASLRGLRRTVLVNLAVLPIALLLLVTGIGTALVFAAANAWLLGRELTEMVWLRHAKGASLPVGAATRLALGGIVTVLLLVPFVNLVAPVLGAASATHLVHGRRAIPENIDA